MTLLWILLTAMCSAAAVLVAAPFLRRLDGRDTALARDVEIYRDQLREVEREAADGLIDAEQAESASQEIKRRLLAADRSSEAAPAPESFGQRNFAIIAVAGIVVLGSTILYAINGRPDLPSVTHASRVAVAESPSAPAMPAAARMPTPAPSKVAENQEQPASAQPTTLPSVDSMIERLAARLKAKPDDAEGWRTLGWSYTAMDRHADAVEAYAKAVALRPDMASYQAGHGEAMVRAANGTLSLQAKVAFEAALKLDPKEPRARFFQGVARQQEGDKAEALEIWIALLNDATPEDSWATELRLHTNALAAEMGVDISARLPGTAPAAAAAAPAAHPAPMAPVAAHPAPEAKGPTAADVSNAEAMTPEARKSMVDGMVVRLVARLEKSPRDTQGWIMLIRSRKVMGDADGAKEALDKAVKVFADTPDEQGQIVAAAKEMGVTQ